MSQSCAIWFDRGARGLFDHSQLGYVEEKQRATDVIKQLEKVPEDFRAVLSILLVC